MPIFFLVLVNIVTRLVKITVQKAPSALYWRRNDKAWLFSLVGKIVTCLIFIHFKLPL